MSEGSEAAPSAAKGRGALLGAYAAILILWQLLVIYQVVSQGEIGPNAFALVIAALNLVFLGLVLALRKIGVFGFCAMFVLSTAVSFTQLPVDLWLSGSAVGLVLTGILVAVAYPRWAQFS